ncbi:MAG TPA: FMN-binding protein [Candidatus Krumholzibacteria bacterium]|nr:FMN-binding protein [Candidatus Krumholzibacteria bacterium]HRX52220.1 FMN-binding protein [Candidatus Krumholzibacteria bacterium]
MRTAGIILTAAAGLLLAAAAPAETPAWRQITVFRPHDQAVAEAFAAADTAWAETWHPDDAERLALADALGDAVPEPEFTFHRASGDGHDLGWVLILDELGLHEPITHLIKVGPDRRVEEVQVLVFRETRGDQIKRPRFLKQFRGRQAGDRLEVGRDVDGVTGATYSSRAIARGVRKALALVEARYPRPRDLAADQR